MFRAIGAISRNIVVANAVGSMFMLGFFLMGGFIIDKSKQTEAHMPFPPASVGGNSVLSGLNVLFSTAVHGML